MSRKEYDAGRSAYQAGEKQHDGVHVRGQSWLDGFCDAQREAGDFDRDPSHLPQEIR